MSNILRIKCIVFRIVFSMLIFVLAVPDNTKAWSAEEIRTKYSASGDPQILSFYCANNEVFDEVLRNGGFKKVVEEIKPKELYIWGYNSLTDEDIKGVKLNENMKMFILNGSKITDMNELFGDWNKKLVKVDILTNMLESLPTGLKNVPVLKELNIRKNPVIFENWNKLNAKDIEKYKESGSFTTLDILKMDGNKLSGINKWKLSSFLELFPNITDLSISNSELPRTISISLKKLKRLDISYNSELKRIEHTEDNPELFKGLEELNMYRCEKLSISNKFVEKLKNVKYLNIMGVSDKSKYDYGAICKLEKLRVLCIEGCKIDTESIFAIEHVEITHSQDYYLKLVKENRRSEEVNKKRVEELWNESVEKLNRKKRKLEKMLEELNKKRRVEWPWRNRRLNKKVEKKLNRDIKKGEELLKRIEKLNRKREKL